MIKLLAFDLDGTLIDSAADIAAAMNRTFRHHGRPELSEAHITSHIGEGLRKLLTDLMPEVTDESEKEELVDQFLEFYEQDMMRTTRVYPGVEEVLANWPGLIAIITNKNERPTRQLLEYFKLDRFPWCAIYGADTLAHRKPSPIALQTLMQNHGLKPHEILMIGDGIPDMQSAQRAGVPVLGVSYGYTDWQILSQFNPLGPLEKFTDLPGFVASLP